MEPSEDRKKPPADQEAAQPGRMTPEQIADDMKRYAREHRFHGGLHELDSQEARQVWVERRKEEVPAGFAPERSAGADEQPEEVSADRLEPIGPEKSFCAAHPDADSPWVCTDCGARFCEQCIRPMVGYFNTSHGGYEHATAVCPRCGGRCVSQRFEAEKQQRIGDKERQEKRSRVFRHSMFALLSLPFAYGVVTHYDGVDPLVDLEYILFVFAVLTFGFLRDLDLRYKSFFVRVLPGFFVMNLFLYLAAAAGHSRLLFTLLATPLKYVLLSGWCGLLLMGVERSLGFFAFLFKGSQEPQGLTRKDRYILGFAVAALALSVVLLIASVAMSVLS